MIAETKWKTVFRYLTAATLLCRMVAVMKQARVESVQHNLKQHHRQNNSYKIRLSAKTCCKNIFEN